MRTLKYKQWVMAQIIEFLPPTWETWIEFLSPGIDPGLARRSLDRVRPHLGARNSMQGSLMCVKDPTNLNSHLPSPTVCISRNLESEAEATSNPGPLDMGASIPNSIITAAPKAEYSYHSINLLPINSHFPLPSKFQSTRHPLINQFSVSLHLHNPDISYKWDPTTRGLL